MKKKTINEPLKDLLPAVVQDQGWARQLDLHSIFPRWSELASQEITEHARPLKIDKDVLWLEVENSAWLSELQFAKLEILDCVNRVLRLGKIRDIKMVLPKKTEKNPYFDGFDEGPAVRYVTPDPDEVRAFAKQVAVIEDEACRQALMQFWYLAKACLRDEK